MGGLIFPLFLTHNPPRCAPDTAVEMARLHITRLGVTTDVCNILIECWTKRRTRSTGHTVHEEYFKRVLRPGNILMFSYK
jgi:hypothetical protein